MLRVKKILEAYELNINMYNFQFLNYIKEQFIVNPKVTTKDNNL